MIDALAKAVLARDRRALSRAITLVESQAPAHRKQARELLASLLPQKPKFRFRQLRWLRRQLWRRRASKY